MTKKKRIKTASLIFLALLIIGALSVHLTLRDSTRGMSETGGPMFSVEDFINAPTPMFTNVKHIFVYVQYMDSRSRSDKKEEEVIPEPLKKENIEKLLVGMYSTRFSSKKCEKGLEYGLSQNYLKELHECKDQPVQLMTKIDYSRYLRSEQKPAGSMYVVFVVGISGYYSRHHSPPFEDSIVSYNTIHSRPGDNLFSSSTPHAFPITQDDEVIKKLLTWHIKSHIHQ